MENRAMRDMLGWIAVNQIILSGYGYCLSRRFAKTTAGSTGAAKGVPALRTQRENRLTAPAAAPRETPKPSVSGKETRKDAFDKSRYTIDEAGNGMTNAIPFHEV